MNKSFAALMAVVLGGCWLVGCNDLPPEVRTGDGKVITAVPVQADDAVEVAGVKNAEVARADYKYALTVLKDYYFKVGNMDKMMMAQNEMKNLESAQYFRFIGVTITQPGPTSLTSADERLLVEEVIADRNGWLSSLDQLLQYYKSQNNALKARLIESVLARFGPVERYTYFMEAEIPGPQLRPTDVVPAADALYARAFKLFQEGKGGLHTFVTTDYAREREAVRLFRNLIQKYPTSTKIALSAYYIADIYKEYFNEDVRAVKWYERAWQWDPHITEPARFQAATVYDIRLKDPLRALQFYKASLKDDPWRVGNREWAQDRIEALGGNKK